MSIIFLLETHAGFVSFNHFSPELGAGKHFPQKVGVISLYVWSYWHKKVV
jgi:hypothetical protein